MHLKLIMLILFVLITVLSFAVPRDMCIVEIATGTWCYYCPGAAMAADELIENGNHAAIIEYHNGDAYTTSESNARNTYYGITGVPTGFFDGILTVGGGDHTNSMYSSYLPKVNTRLAVSSDFTLRGTAALNNNAMSVQAVAKLMEPNTNTNIRMQIVLVESDIMISWQGQNHIDFVERSMFPNANGTVVTFNSNPRQSVIGDFTLGTAWVHDNMEVVIFLQDLTTKEILQGTKFSFSEITKIPTGLTAEAVQGNHALLNWTPPTQTALGYAVYKNDEFLDFVEVANTSYTDPTPLTGPTTYAVTALFDSGESLLSIDAAIEPVGNNDHTQPIAVQSCIKAIYPNPFSYESRISYSVKNTGAVSIRIYNLRGQQVREISGTTKAAGSYTTSWDGKDDHGTKLSNGIYFVRMQSNDSQDTKKIMLIN
jgi:hypothetical protein